MQLILQQVAITQRESQEELRQFKEEVRTIVRSNDRTIQAMLDQTAADRLNREAEAAVHREQMAELRHISRGLVNMLDSIDSDRPTILRKLNTIENKTDVIIERLSRDRSIQEQDSQQS